MEDLAVDHAEVDSEADHAEDLVDRTEDLVDTIMDQEGIGDHADPFSEDGTIVPIMAEAVALAAF